MNRKSALGNICGERRAAVKKPSPEDAHKESAVQSGEQNRRAFVFLVTALFHRSTPGDHEAAKKRRLEGLWCEEWNGIPLRCLSQWE
ncbi:MAG: hypothetical protein HFE39_10025 [Clostridiales bacterium]|nr:hypothetical protein [Clostridiales bacterium]